MNKEEFDKTGDIEEEIAEKFTLSMIDVSVVPDSRADPISPFYHVRMAKEIQGETVWAERPIYTSPLFGACYRFYVWLLKRPELAESLYYNSTGRGERGGKADAIREAQEDYERARIHLLKCERLLIDARGAWLNAQVLTMHRTQSTSRTPIEVRTCAQNPQAHDKLQQAEKAQLEAQLACDLSERRLQVAIALFTGALANV